MKFFLAFVLMLIFSTQVLPVKKMSKLMGKAQGTEQLQDDDSDDDDVSGGVSLNYNDVILPSFSFDFSANSHCAENKILLNIQGAEALPLVRLNKIPSPPPEC
jgi:hypothetical protein